MTDQSLTIDQELEAIVDEVLGEERAAEYIPRSALEEIVQKRLESDSRLVRQKQVDQQFAVRYGYTPEQMLGTAPQSQQGAWNPNNVQVPYPQQPQPQPQQRQLPPTDQMVKEVYDWKIQQEIDAATVAEANEFKERFTGVRFEDIPAEVLARHSRGGISLAEAYANYLVANPQIMRSNAARDYALSAQRIPRYEGATYRGNASGPVDMVTPDEANFAKDAFGLSPKELVRFRAMAAQINGSR